MHFFKSDAHPKIAHPTPQEIAHLEEINTDKKRLLEEVDSSRKQLHDVLRLLAKEKRSVSFKLSDGWSGHLHHMSDLSYMARLNGPQDSSLSLSAVSHSQHQEQIILRGIKDGVAVDDIFEITTAEEDQISDVQLRTGHYVTMLAGEVAKNSVERLRDIAVRFGELAVPTVVQTATIQ